MITTMTRVTMITGSVMIMFNTMMTTMVLAMDIPWQTSI